MRGNVVLLFPRGNGGISHFWETLGENSDVGLHVTVPVTPSNTVFKLSVTISCRNFRKKLSPETRLNG